MSALVISPVDPLDEDQLAGWHAVYAASRRHRDPDTAMVFTLPELRVELLHRGPRRWKAGYVGTLDGTPVVSGFIETPELDNLTLAEIRIDTQPEHRGQGHGSAMLAHLEQVARGRGRSVLTTMAAWGLDSAEDGTGNPAVAFLAEQGFELSLVDIQRWLTLPVDDSRLQQLADDAAARHPSYALRSWVGPVPDDLVQGWVELESTLMTEAPMGELAWEAEVADVAARRDAEAQLVRQGRTPYSTVALDSAGVVVAYTEVVATAHEPGKGYQWGTLVRPADRGHRLGLAVKVANVQLIQRERPDLTQLVTWNAEVNSHMVAVNEQLGFEPVERLGEFQKRLA